MYILQQRRAHTGVSFIKNDLHIPKRFLGAFKVGHRPSSKEFIDEDLSRVLLKRVLESNYEDTEALHSLEYITRFNNEFHKNVVRRDDTERLHKTDNQVKDLYSRENSKNRDVMSVRKGNLHYFGGASNPWTDEPWADGVYTGLQERKASFRPRSRILK